MAIVRASILSEGTSLDPIFELISIDVTLEVNRIPTAQLVLLDGDPASQKFPLSDKSTFEPGKTVEIKLGYEGQKVKDQSVFKGLVVKHGLEVDFNGSTLTVELKDKAIGLLAGRHSNVFKDLKDDGIIKKILKDAKLSTGEIASTKVTHPEMVQYYSTDWDFILSRAEANNLLVKVESGELSTIEPKVGGPALSLSFGMDEIFNLNLEADASNQFDKIESVAWDIKEQKLTAKKVAANWSTKQGDLKPGQIAKKLGANEMLLNSPVALDADELKNWADGQMMLSRLSLIKGVISIPGRADLSLMDTVKLDRFGNRFDGSTLITGIRHRVDKNGWMTDIQIGLSATRYAEQYFNLMDRPAAGLLPGINGLQIGIVNKFEADKDKQLRVRVVLPGVDEEKGLLWARLATPDGGKGRGYFSRPEKGDEVVVGFFNDDPRQAVILGALYSSKNNPPEIMKEPSEDNFLKGFVTKEGLTLLFNDEDKSITLSTKEGNKIWIDEKTKTIEIVDMNKNKILMNDKGVEIESIDKMIFKAKGDLELKGANIKIEASSNVEIKGSAVDVK